MFVFGDARRHTANSSAHRQAPGQQHMLRKTKKYSDFHRFSVCRIFLVLWSWEMFLVSRIIYSSRSLQIRWFFPIRGCWGIPSRFMRYDMNVKRKLLSDCQKFNVFGIIDHSLRTDYFTYLCSSLEDVLLTMSNLRGYPSVLGSEKTHRIWRDLGE